MKAQNIENGNVNMYYYFKSKLTVKIIYSVRNNFVQLSSNFCMKIATQIVNRVAKCSN